MNTAPQNKTFASSNTARAFLYACAFATASFAWVFSCKADGVAITSDTRHDVAVKSSGGKSYSLSGETPLVQIALLLDTSGSMEGAIKQAKTQIWSIVNEFANATRDGKPVRLEVALYHYGSPELGKSTDYIRQLEPLGQNLDRISEQLFRLTTSGGDEYCGAVIHRAVTDLSWSRNPRDYKAIFIVGNESFDQGPEPFRNACRVANGRGIIVNTIHCHGAEDTYWGEAAKIAYGEFMRIDHNRAVVEVSAPQDAELARLNERLNRTYLGYGARAKASMKSQVASDQYARSLSPSNVAERVVAKSSRHYENSNWDLVDASKKEDGEKRLREIKSEELPEEMRTMTEEERIAYVGKKAQEREAVQAQIQKLAGGRSRFLADAEAANANAETLGGSVRGAIRSQATTQGFAFPETPSK